MKPEELARFERELSNKSQLERIDERTKYTLGWLSRLEMRVLGMDGKLWAAALVAIAALVTALVAFLA